MLTRSKVPSGFSDDRSSAAAEVSFAQRVAGGRCNFRKLKPAQWRGLPVQRRACGSSPCDEFLGCPQSPDTTRNETPWGCMTAPATQHHGWRDRRSPIVDNGKLKTRHTSQFAHAVRSSLNACLDLLLLSALLVELMRQTFTFRGENSAVESRKNWRWQTLSR